jgi:hypothetical protein
MVVICGWCERFLGFKEPLEQDTVSHSICLACEERQAWEEFPTIVVSRDRAHLVPALKELLRGEPEIPIMVDRRVSERRRIHPGLVVPSDRRRAPERRRGIVLSVP